MRAFPIHDEHDLERAHALVERLWDAEPGTEEGDLLEVMATLVDAYEAQRSVLPPANPRELIRFKLDELGWSGRELARRLGWSGGRVSEVLNGKRNLTLAMVRQLSAALEIPAGLLVHDGAEEAPAKRMEARVELPVTAGNRGIVADSHTKPHFSALLGGVA